MLNEDVYNIYIYLYIHGSCGILTLLNSDMSTIHEGKYIKYTPCILWDTGIPILSVHLNEASPLDRRPKK